MNNGRSQVKEGLGPWIFELAMFELARLRHCAYHTGSNHSFPFVSGTSCGFIQFLHFCYGYEPTGWCCAYQTLYQTVCFVGFSFDDVIMTPQGDVTQQTTDPASALARYLICQAPPTT